MYCSECGAEIERSASFCSECGQSIVHTDTNGVQPETEPRGSDGNGSSSIVTLVLLGILWVVFFVAFPGITNPNAIGAVLSTLAVVSSIPLLWLDARSAIRAGELSTSRPIYVVLAVFLLYLLTMPVYLAYRLYRRI